VAAADGRDTRWDEHRSARRVELVEQTLRAIRKQGAGVGMDEIAAQAGTSKTVIYRHFGDRAGLNTAVVDLVHDDIHRRLEVALDLTDANDVGRLAHEMAEVYLTFVESDPEIYRFVTTAPSSEIATRIDPYSGLAEIMGDHIGEAIANHLEELGQDPSCALAWGHGMVGFAKAVADRWLAGGRAEPRDQIMSYIDDFVGAGLVAGLAAVPKLAVPRLQEPELQDQ